MRKLGASIPPDLAAVLEKLALHRSDVCEEQLHTDEVSGKELLTRMLGGSGIPSQWVGNDFVADVQKLVRCLRWLACTLLPEVHDKCKQDGRRYPESSTLFFLWTAAEDVILHAWFDFILQHRVSHLSLHFDGVRISKPLPAPVDEFCKQCSDHIFEATGFNVSICQK